MYDNYLEVSRSNLMQTVSWLTNETPYRLAGSSDERKAAHYILEQLEDFGLETQMQVFNVYNSVPLKSRLFINNINEEIQSLPFAHIRSTDDEGINLDLVYAGAGSESDYAGIDVKGKAVLLQVSYAPPVPEKARIAASHGATAIICMNWGNDEAVICNRGLKGVWGNPTEKTFKEIPDIIGVGISRNDGLRLKNLCINHEKVSVNITAKSERYWSSIHQPFAKLSGNGSSNDIIIVSSHLDAWSPGVTCNATGNSSTLEIARILANQREILDRNIYFLFWSGHEIAEAAGSTWFLDNFWDELNKNAIAYIHIDSTGILGTSIFEIKASPELKRYAEENFKHFSEDTYIRSSYLKKIGDQSFMGIGIPSITQRFSFTDNEIALANGATLGWWNHTIQDGLDKYDPDILLKDTEVTLRLIKELATQITLPYSLEDVLNDIDSRLLMVIHEYGTEYDFSGLKNAYDEASKNLRKVVQMFKNSKQPELVNALLRKASRILSPVILTYSGKYSQDSYGAEMLTFPIPLLFEVQQLRKTESGTLKYGIIETQLRRNYNQLVDAFNEINEFALLYSKAYMSSK